MAEGKSSFVLYTDQKEIFDSVDNEQAGKLIKHIFSYVTDENPTTDDAIVRALFIGIKQALKRDLNKWETKQEQRKLAGQESARKRKEALKFSKEKTKNPTTVNDRQHPSTVSVSVSGNGSVSDSVNVLSKMESDKNARAINILKKQKQEELDILWMQNKKQIDDKVRLVESFNDKMDIELDQGKIEFSPEQLMPRFRTYVRQWVNNQKTNSKTPAPDSYESGKLPRKN